MIDRLLAFAGEHDLKLTTGNAEALIAKQFANTRNFG